MITFTVRTSHPVKEVNFKFLNGYLFSIEHDRLEYGIERVSLNGTRNLERDYPLEQTLVEVVSQGQVRFSDLHHQFRFMTIVFTENITFDASVIGSPERQTARLIRIFYKPRQDFDRQG
jgi:hypothetical protein